MIWAGRVWTRNLRVQIDLEFGAPAFGVVIYGSKRTVQFGAPAFGLVIYGSKSIWNLVHLRFARARSLRSHLAGLGWDGLGWLGWLGWAGWLALESVAIYGRIGFVRG